VTVGIAEVLDVEADWYVQDLVAQGVAALTKDAGGPFGVVTPRLRRLSQVAQAVYLTHGQTRQGKGAKDQARFDHDVIAVVLWAATGAGARAHVDQEAADAAVARVVDRVLGPTGDTTHGGRWFSIGPVVVEPPGPLELLAWSDAVAAAGAAYVITVRYTVSEFRAR
jgi:hypothetical protein